MITKVSGPAHLHCFSSYTQIPTPVTANTEQQARDPGAACFWCLLVSQRRKETLVRALAGRVRSNKCDGLPWLWCGVLEAYPRTHCGADEVHSLPEAGQCWRTSCWRRRLRSSEGHDSEHSRQKEGKALRPELSHQIISHLTRSELRASCSPP